MNALRAPMAGNSKPACDRCRGQKLRCIWETEGLKCRRCTRADAVCVASPRRPLGRPPARLSDSAGVQASFGWEDAQADIIPPVHPPGSSSSIPAQRRVSVLSSIGSLPDDGQWAVRSAASINMSSSSASLASDTNSLLSSSPGASMNMDLEELLDDFLDTPPANKYNNNTHAGIHSPLPAAPTDGGFPSDPRRIFETPTPPAPTQSIGSDDTLMPIPLSDLAAGDSTPVGSREADLTYIKKLYKIHVVLVEHPLYDDDLLAARTRGGTSARTSELQLGRLFEMTAELKGLTRHATFMEGAGQFSRSPSEKVIALLTLSCYTGFSHVYGRAIASLREVQISGQKLGESQPLMSGLTIDGFSLGGCWDFQLNFVVNVCEQIRQRLDATIERTRGYI